MRAKNFMMFTVGNAEFIHRQANFAALSILANTVPEDRATITIITDRPDWYAWLGDRISVLPIDHKTLTEWRGVHDHFFRIKIKAMQLMVERLPGDLIYLDSDVACDGPLNDFLEQLARGQCFMDERVYLLSGRGGSARETWVKARGNTYGKFTITEDSAMWCAGVVALPAERSTEYLADALECMDQMCAGKLHKNHLEQLALSLSLSRGGDLKPTTQWLKHYWGNKDPWNALIAAFLGNVGVKALSVEQACQAFREMKLDVPRILRRSRLERFAVSVGKRVKVRDTAQEASVKALLTR